MRRHLIGTREVARRLGLGIAALQAHLLRGNVPRPRRRLASGYAWTQREVAAARKALAIPGRRRPRKVRA